MLASLQYTVLVVCACSLIKIVALMLYEVQVESNLQALIVRVKQLIKLFLPTGSFIYSFIYLCILTD